MAALLVILPVMAVTIAVGGILDDYLPNRYWDKLFKMLHID